ncbi:MAG: CoA transferase [Chloroflexi bacterium]|nr:CoA transferase [Chloroflexota bacterium]
MTATPLGGTRVLDFSWVLAGPYCSMLLAMAGADVIRVETLQRADFISRQPGTAEGTNGPLNPNSTPRFNTINLSKRSVQLDLHTKDGIQLAKELVRLSDVVVENYRPGTFARLGLGYQDLKKVRPDIVMVSISGMGQEGPESQYAAYAANFGALSGMGYLTSYSDGIPTEMRGVLDLLTGTTACFAVLAALHHRSVTGEGQYLDLAAREVISCCLGDLFLDLPLNDRSPKPAGNSHPSVAPHGVYPCKEVDSWVSIAVYADEEWSALCAAMGRPDLLEDPRFRDQLNRWRHQGALEQQISAWTRTYSDIEVMRLLQQAGVAAMPSFSSKGLSEDLHLQQRQIFQRVQHPELGSLVVLGPPFRLVGSPLRIASAAPLLGEHNAEVFGDLLGLSQEEVRRLGDNGVIN